MWTLGNNLGLSYIKMSGRCSYFILLPFGLRVWACFEDYRVSVIFTSCQRKTYRRFLNWRLQSYMRPMLNSCYFIFNLNDVNSFWFPVPPFSLSIFLGTIFDLVTLFYCFISSLTFLFWNFWSLFVEGGNISRASCLVLIFIFCITHREVIYLLIPRIWIWILM